MLKPEEMMQAQAGLAVLGGVIAIAWVTHWEVRVAFWATMCDLLAPAARAHARIVKWRQQLKKELERLEREDDERNK